MFSPERGQPRGWSCLRTGQRCMSYFHNEQMNPIPLVFADGVWIVNSESEGSCSLGGSSREKWSGTQPLAQPLQDPIAVLTGTGRPWASLAEPMQHSASGDRHLRGNTDAARQ